MGLDKQQNMDGTNNLLKKTYLSSTNVQLSGKETVFLWCTVNRFIAEEVLYQWDLGRR